METKNIKVGDKVEVVKQNFGCVFLGKKGIVTSIGAGVIPIHVTLLGEQHETDFAPNELEVQ
jgi:hypothetical protein